MASPYRFLVDYDIFSARHAAQQRGWQRVAELTYRDQDGIEVTLIAHERNLIGTRGIELYVGKGFYAREDRYSFTSMLLQRDCVMLELPSIQGVA